METNSYMPLPGPLGLDSNRLCTRPTTLVVNESYSHIDIRTAEGTVVATCKRKHLSSQREFYDADHRLLFTLRRNHVSFPASFYLTSGPDNKRIVEFKGKLAFAHPKIDVLFNSTAASIPQPVKLEVRGKVFERNAVILWDAAPVARVTKEVPQFKEAIVNSRSWSVEVMQNVDLLLMAVIVVAIDEQRRAQQRGWVIGVAAANS